MAAGGGGGAKTARGAASGAGAGRRPRAPEALTMKPAAHYYEYRHIVTFQETNLVGNVYYTNHLAWQGRCRELFLREHAPEVVEELGKGLCLATVSCACEYFAELTAFDEVAVRMRLVEQVQNRMRLAFEYWRGKELVARGEQQIACMKRDGKNFAPAPVPKSLQAALAQYAE
jgi:enediyne biosynthesis thioesterase